MSTFAERLAAAAAAPPKTTEVTVLLDVGLAERRADLVDRIAVAKASTDNRMGRKSDAAKLEAELEELDVEAAEALDTFQFSRMPGDQWAALTARHPVRLETPLDRQYGYNFHAATQEAATGGKGFDGGKRLEGDEWVPVEKDEWKVLFTVLSGHEVIRIADAIWELNEWAPSQRIAELKKLSLAAKGSARS